MDYRDVRRPVTQHHISTRMGDQHDLMLFESPPSQALLGWPYVKACRIMRALSPSVARPAYDFKCSPLHDLSLHCSLDAVGIEIGARCSPSAAFSRSTTGMRIN